MNEPFVVINSDDFYGREAYDTVSKFLTNIDKESEKLQCAMVGYKLVNTVTENGSVKRGICKEENGKLVELIESKIEKENGKYIAYPLENNTSFEVSEDALVSMNMFAFHPKIFTYLEKGFVEFLNENKDDLTKEFLIPSYVFELIQKGVIDVSVLETDAKWLGVTYKEDKEHVVSEIKKLHKQKIYDEKLWN